MAQADIGLIGLAVMGQNLVLNMNDHGFQVAVYNRTHQKTKDFINGAAKDTQIQATYSIEELVGQLKSPRIVMLMVKAGEVVDHFIQQLLSHLTPGDIIIDGGNSRYIDTNRRVTELKAQGIRYIGSGVSGGEAGARNGPSIMPGGETSAWPAVKPILQAIAAKAEGQACCQWVGNGGSGHYVKMVHNGIEYGDMQLIAEAWQLLREGLKLDDDTVADIFKQWNQGVLDSYLIEITAEILATKAEDGSLLVDKILDSAGQKGTGKWTGISALDTGIPLTLVTEAVFARCLSARKAERQRAASIFQKSVNDTISIEQETIIQQIHDALYASKIISYAQGFMLMREAAKEYGWSLEYGNIALMWRGGCIIRSQFLGEIKQAFEKKPQLENLLLDDFFAQAIQKTENNWRKAVIFGIERGIPTPAFNAALAFFDGYRSERLPASLLQAQRDYFGAHQYERIDRARGEFFHTDWTGRGGNAASSTYQV
ncbi:decarboxylating NADP(+)-dependent phosphogluconate dehydrogenase [Candidatus Venteria ishoeyi]|uniref:decarboxylating NADP(+)-dependent phosphogluconate dehydrogenase n=1 Tax=Candidatus Venteria ishoeyi TaxID=1899563 RepID=UPI0025A647EF|nr:decarboxylating NADP(+)-dependent phosphogluconate dehydrogenase [Candidatus Venteria ishoeyi]MDM8547415.1 decarboxylating NADP(+)-dependent phosphogluconate dehydrogenase [Candidatus Venteria ishoeyi]